MQASRMVITYLSRVHGEPCASSDREHAGGDAQRDLGSSGCAAGCELVGSCLQLGSDHRCRREHEQQGALGATKTPACHLRAVQKPVALRIWAARGSPPGGGGGGGGGYTRCLTGVYALGILGSSYTPAMAKRFNISIPDALAERLEPHKHRISLSAVMQAALERELAQLNLSDEDKQRRTSLKAVATEAWLKRNPFIAKHLSTFIDHLLDQAINDGNDRLFGYYRQLFILLRFNELVEKAARSNSFSMQSDESPEQRAKHAINYALALYDGFMYGYEGFCDGFTKYLGGKAIRKEINLPGHLLNREVDDLDLDVSGHELFSMELLNLINSLAIQKLALSVMDDKLRAMLSDEDIDSFVLDFEAAFAEMEVEEFDLEAESK